MKARDDGQVTVDMGPPELNGPKVPSTLPTNEDGIVLQEPIQVGSPADNVLFSSLFSDADSSVLSNDTTVCSS